MPIDPNQADALRKALAEYDAGGSSGGGWQQAPPAAGPGAILGVNIPIKVQTPDGGSVRCYIVLPASAIASPSALLGTIQGLIASGVPVDVYQPKPAWNGGNGGGGWRGGNGGGGYGQRRGW